MRNSIIKSVLFVLITLSAQLSFATTYTTISNGSWNSKSTWDSNGVPKKTWSLGDTININHQVTLNKPLTLSYYVTNISAGGKISGSKEITLESAGSVIVNHGEIEISNVTTGYIDGDALIENYGVILVSSTFTIASNIVNKKTNTEHGYIEANNMKLESSGKLTNQHHIKVNNELTVSATASIINSSTAIMVLKDANLIDNSIVNDGRIYIDRSLTAPTWPGATPIKGSGSTCNTAGNADVTNSSQACNNAGPIDPTFPIELIQFSVVKVQSVVEIEWATATEENNDFFTIERSEDGQNWEVVEMIQGAGNSNKLLYYEYKDYMPLEGLSYYRLKQTDYDGAYTYSKVVAVNTQERKEKNNMKVSPNPVVDRLQLEVHGASVQEIAVYNVMGQEVSSQIGISQSGENKFQIDMSQVPEGVYIIRTLNNSVKVLKK